MPRTTMAVATLPDGPTAADLTQQQIGSLMDRVAKLEAQQIKSAGYREILTAVETAAKTVNIEPAIQERMSAAICLQLPTWDLHDYARTAVTRLIEENNSHWQTLLVAELSGSPDFRRKVVAMCGAGLLDGVDVTTMTGAALTERLDAIFAADDINRHIASAIISSEAGIARRLTNSSTFMSALMGNVKEWIKTISFNLHPTR